jgi:GNAT superfamily N-acetyltransferase
LGKPTGFVHFVLREHLIDLRLLAVDPAHNNGLLGLGLLNGSLLWGRDHGARQAIAKIAAGNTDVMNLYTALGFTFRQPELVFHRHACSAPHLLP